MQAVEPQQQPAIEIKPRRIETPNFQHLVEVCQVLGVPPPAFAPIQEAPQLEEKDMFDAAFSFLTASRPMVSADQINQQGNPQVQPVPFKQYLKLTFRQLLAKDNGLQKDTVNEETFQRVSGHYKSVNNNIN
jgi:hypothetical protein